LAIACDALRRPKEAAHFRNLGREMDRLTTLISRADDPNASRNLALHLEFAACCAALGRDIEAVTWLKLAVALDPLDPRAQQAIFHLESKMKK
jgi:Flp pilus assembly protein TadD